MEKGGYQIINLASRNIETGTPVQYADLYELIEATRKPILLSGLVVNDREYHDCFVECSVNGTSYVMTAYGYTITITDTNIVTVTNA